MSAKTFREWRAEMDRRAGNQISLLEARILNEGWDAGQESLRAALLADAPDVEGLVESITLLSKVYEDGSRPLMAELDPDKVIATLLSQAARIKVLEEQVANLKGHAEAMATTLDHWTSIDACKCAALDAYRRDHPEEPK